MKKILAFFMILGVFALGCSKNETASPNGDSTAYSAASGTTPTVNNCQTTGLQQIKYEVTGYSGPSDISLDYSDNCHHNYGDLAYHQIVQDVTLNKTVKSGDTCYYILYSDWMASTRCTLKVYQNCVLRATVITNGNDYEGYFVVNTESGNCGGGGGD